MLSHAGVRYQPRSASTLDLYVDQGLQLALQKLDETKKNVDRAVTTSGHLYESARRNPPAFRRAAWAWARRKLLSVTTALIILWLFALYLGEVLPFDHAARDCDWKSWESWPSGASPHRIALVADPQLVDPHTYPGRPWPLFYLTVKHTDVYLRRSYTRIQQDLDPHTVLFLGDLFDGGREWGTPLSHSPDERYRSYGRKFWLAEFDRFASIFLRERRTSRLQTRRRDGRRIIASLPGNHDLGFGRGIQLPVRDRFQAVFGEGNRVDILGNHTFVSLDSVSLSAQDQNGNDQIWGPTFDFLQTISTEKDRAVARHLRHIYHQPEPADPRREAKILDLQVPEDTANLRAYVPLPAFTETQKPVKLPTILLTHVPLYREQDTDCGPLRERGKAIPISAGYQYQNTLTPKLTDDVIQAVGSDGTLAHAFSGDDHDYCEVVHGVTSERMDRPGLKDLRLKEMTVKSLSWAMGVRRPGFLLVSLWNPISEQGSPLAGKGDATIQTQLCLLPDQLALFIQYAYLLGFSLVVMLVRSVFTIVRGTDTKKDEGFMNGYAGVKQKQDDPYEDGWATADEKRQYARTSSSTSEQRPLSARARGGSISSRTPSATQAPFYPTMRGDSLVEHTRPAHSQSQWQPKRQLRPIDTGSGLGRDRKKRDDPEGDEEHHLGYAIGHGHGYSHNDRSRRREERRGCTGIILEFRDGIWRVARVVLVWWWVLFVWW